MSSSDSVYSKSPNNTLVCVFIPGQQNALVLLQLSHE